MNEDQLPANKSFLIPAWQGLERRSGMGHPASDPSATDRLWDPGPVTSLPQALIIGPSLECLQR